MRSAIVIGELVIAALCLLGAVLSWGNGVIRTAFAPVGDLPAFEATRYSAPWLVLATFLVAVAGLVLIDAVTRTVRTVRA